jgi:hypothetical protein
MTQTLNIPDHQGHQGFHFTKEETECPGFNDRQEYCGQIWFFDSWTVPAKVHETLGLQNQIDLYLTSEGHWAPSFEQAEHYLSSTEPPQEFFVRGAILGLFVPGEWAEENGTPGTYTDYRVFRRSAGYWDAEEVEEPRVLAGAEYF